MSCMRVANLQLYVPCHAPSRSVSVLMSITLPRASSPIEWSDSATTHSPSSRSASKFERAASGSITAGTLRLLRHDRWSRACHVALVLRCAASRPTVLRSTQRCAATYRRRHVARPSCSLDMYVLYYCRLHSLQPPSRWAITSFRRALRS